MEKLLKWVYKNSKVTTNSLITDFAFILPGNAFNAFEEFYKVIHNTYGIYTSSRMHIL